MWPNNWSRRLQKKHPAVSTPPTVINYKAGLLRLVEEIGKVSHACEVMGYN